jgi:hypothetical protein
MHMGKETLSGWTIETETWDDGWRVHLEAPYVDGGKSIYIHANGTIARISP